MFPTQLWVNRVNVIKKMVNALQNEKKKSSSIKIINPNIFL